MKKWIDSVCALRREYESFADSALKNAMNDAAREARTLRDVSRLMGRVFALAGESCRRHLGLTPYPVQYQAAKILSCGGIAQMNTGEGKTLAAVPPACLRALEGRGAHVVTVNEYLARRDFESNKPVYEALGLSVGLSLSGMSAREKQSAYNADITYTTATEAGFDYLRDGVAVSPSLRVQRPLYYAIVDEADSVLLDEAVTPMILSAGGTGEVKDYIVTDTFVKYLKCLRLNTIDDDADTDGFDCDYVVDERAKNALLTSRGVSRAERYFRIDNLFDARNLEIYHRILQAISAYGTLERDVDYIIRTGRVAIVDRSTGRVMEGRRYSAGLHQAIEAKEGLEIHQESRVLSSITYQNYFGLYPLLSGMTGTAWTSRRELGETYKTRVSRVPPNRPCVRIDRPDRYFETSKEKLDAVCDDAEAAWIKGRPVLIGTPNDRVSEKTDSMLTARGIPHRVLSAKQDADEAELIAGAGKSGSVVVATNMAGRGTDIRLGGGDAARADEVRSSGGLLVLGAERQKSRRVDDQLIGRAGRQGDPGESRFFVSREDDVIRLYGESDRKLDAREVRRAQEKSESADASQRAEALRTDSVLQAFRRGFLTERNRVLESDRPDAITRDMAAKAVERLVARYTNPDNNCAEFRVAYHRVFGSGAMLEPTEEIDAEAWKEAARRAIDRQREKAGEIFPELARAVILQCMDDGWSNFLEAFEVLKTGYRLMSMGRAEPVLTLVKSAGEALDGEKDWILTESLRRLAVSGFVGK